MTYASKQNLIDRYGSDELLQLTDRANTGSIDDTVITRALADADAEINGYIATRYTLPLSPVPPELERLACDIARYRLYDRSVTKLVEQRYKDAIRVLQDVSAGKAGLGVGTTNQEPTTHDAAQISSTTPVFRRSEAGGFI